jgi:CRP-like cAMP-binding protein
MNALDAADSSDASAMPGSLILCRFMTSPATAHLLHSSSLNLQVKFRAGDTIVRQGDTDTDRFYIVEEGECKAEMDGVEGEVCARMMRGSYFGERALLTDAPRAATVTAVIDTRCLAMDRAAFVRLMGPLTDLLKRNMEVYDKYIS